MLCVYVHSETVIIRLVHTHTRVYIPGRELPVLIIRVCMRRGPFPAVIRIRYIPGKRTFYKSHVYGNPDFRRARVVVAMYTYEFR